MWGTENTDQHFIQKYSGGIIDVAELDGVAGSLSDCAFAASDHLVSNGQSLRTADPDY